MTLDKLIDGAGTGFERELLQSARLDSVPDAARARAAARLHLGSAATAGADAVTRRAGWPMLRKYGWIAVVGGVTALSLTASDDVPSDLPSAREVESNTEVLVVASPAAERPTTESVIVPSVAESPHGKASVPEQAGARSPSRRAHKAVALTLPKSDSPAETSNSRLLDEVRRLDTVRAALRLDACQVALNRLGEYATSFPQGELALEAVMLRLQALAGCGRGDEAAELARLTLSRPGVERYRAELMRYRAAAGR